MKLRNFHLMLIVIVFSVVEKESVAVYIVNQLCPDGQVVEGSVWVECAGISGDCTEASLSAHSECSGFWVEEGEHCRIAIDSVVGSKDDAEFESCCSALGGTVAYNVGCDTFDTMINSYQLQCGDSEDDMMDEGETTSDMMNWMAAYGCCADGLHCCDTCCGSGSDCLGMACVNDDQCSGLSCDCESRRLNTVESPKRKKRKSRRKRKKSLRNLFFGEMEEECYCM